MIYIGIIAGIASFVFFLIILHYLNVKINAGYLIAFFLLFDIYGFILSKIITFITPLFFLILISIFFIIYSFIRDIDRCIEAIKKKEIVLWTVFTFLLLSSLLWTPNKNYGFFKFQIFMLKGFIPGIAIYLTICLNKQINWWPVIVSGLLYISIFFLLKQDFAYSTHRMTIKGFNPIWITRAFLIYVSIVVFALNTTLINKIILTIPGIVGAFSAQSKGPFIGFLVAFGGYYYSEYLKQNLHINKWKLILKIFLSIVLIFIFIIVLFQSIDILQDSRFAVLLSVQKLFSEPTFLDRVVKSIKAINIFSNNLILGAGLGGYSIIDQRNYPHNILLEIASELGLIGLIIWFALIFRIYIISKRNNIFKVLFLQTIIYAMFSGDLGFNTEYVLLSFMILSMSSSN